MNVTVAVAALYKCDSVYQYRKKIVNTFDPLWRQTVTGCLILNILQDMYKFNVSYVYDDLETNVTVFGTENMTQVNTNIDVYARPMNLRSELMEYVYPLHAVGTWSFGFLLSRPNRNFLVTFYSKPFTRRAWNCLYGMAFFVALLFYLLKRSEFSIVGGWECSFAYELLMVIGAYCQHIPPLDAKLPSRRIAYFIFFVFAYIVYTFYASNLLSNLVNDKNHGIDIATLIESNYECVIVDYMKLVISGGVQYYNDNFTLLLNNLLKMRSVSIQDGVEGIRRRDLAVLSDYTVIYPYIKRGFDNDELCNLISIDLFSSVKKYLFTARNFRYKEQLKIGTLRIQESGILKRLLATTRMELPHCSHGHFVHTSFVQISAPFTILICTCFVSVLILVAERIHYQRNKLWPYVE